MSLGLLSKVSSVYTVKCQHLSQTCALRNVLLRLQSGWGRAPHLQLWWGAWLGGQGLVDTGLHCWRLS